MNIKYVIDWLQNDTYQVIGFDHDGDTVAKTVWYQGSLSDCHAYVASQTKEYV